MTDQAILLVTESREVVDPLRSAARSLGRKVIWAESAAEARKQLKRNPVCVIISDDQLPDACGVDFLQDMQEAAPFAIRMLLLLPDAPADRAIDALNQGRVARFLRKPFTDIDEIRLTLQTGISSYMIDAQEREAVENLHYIVHGKAGAANPRTLQIERLCTMGEMAGSLIHKFNNTLTIMMGHLDLLLDEVQGTEMEKRLHLIGQAASDGVDLARTLQEFVRTGPSERQTLNLNSVLTETARMTEPIWKSGARSLRAPIQLVLDTGGIPNIQGNLPELREVFTNLILNAVDAMPEGGRLTVQTGTVSGNIRIQISDEGVGMDSDVQERIFDPFFTTKGKDGNGLGLSIVRRIIEEHSGRISVDSAPGEGTTFTVELPQTQFSQDRSRALDVSDFTDRPSLS
jgi:signal transduction histidine kinase